MITSVVFDLGGVLLDWNPRYLYRNLMKDQEEMEYFLNTICTGAWNHTLDLGRGWEDARTELVDKYPQYTKMIDAYWGQWLEMFSGPIHESVDILMDLKKRGYPVYALSNWNDVKFQVALKEFPFLRLFNGRIVSGEVKLAKPDPAIYQLLLSTFQLKPDNTVFIDDRPENVAAAKEQGIHAIHFTAPAQLENDLAALGLFPDNDGTRHKTPSGGCGGNCTCHAQ